MAISRITTWADGQVLSAADLNAEFNNILNNATTLISPLTGDLDFNLNNATNFALETRTAAPSVVTTGRMYQLSGISLQHGVSGADSTGYRPVSAGAPTRVSGLTGSIISNIGSFAAQGYFMGTPNLGSISITATSSFSINTQTPGPAFGGRDQAAAFGSTEVHFYAIGYSPGSTTIRGICSSNPPPTGPSGVSYWTYLCSAKYSTGSSAVVQSAIVRGSQVEFSTVASAYSLISTATAWTSTTPSVLTSSRVPSIATHVEILPTYYGAIQPPQTNFSGGYTVTVESTPFGSKFRGSLTFDTASTSAGVYSQQSEGYRKLQVGSEGAVLVTSGETSTGLTQIELIVDLIGYTVPNGDN